MPILLSDLRTFCSEVASPDSSGGTSDREFMNWINGALQRLYSEAGWDRVVAERRFTVPPRDTGTDLTVTQGSLALSRTGTFTAAWLSDRYELIISGESRQTFELAAIGTPATTATLRAGDEWIKASASNVSFSAIKTRFDLTEAKEVLRVQDVQTGLELNMLNPEDFDRVKTRDPGQFSTPTFCCFRKNKLEVWPHPGDSYAKLEVSYRKTIDPMTTATAGATEVEWDEELRDLLEKAILLEASLTQGEAAPVPYPLAKAEYEARLAREKALKQRGSLLGPMGVRVPVPGVVRGRLGTTGEVTDA